MNYLIKYKYIALASLISFIPFYSVYGYSQDINTEYQALNKYYFNKIANRISNQKTAEEYLDQAKNIIIDDYTPLLKENKKTREEFIQLVNKSLMLKETARAYLYLGHANYMNLDSIGYKKAIDHYEKALELNPEYVEVFIALGMLHRNNKNFKATITNLEKAIEHNYENELIFNQLAEAKYQVGDHQGAIINLKKAIKINPNNSLNHFHSGRSKHILGDHKGTINDYSKAIELNPNSANYYFFRAFAYLDQNDIKNGCQDLDNASKLGANTSKEMERYCLN